MSNILDVRNLTVTYGKAVAVNNISLTVPEGRIVTLIGANGAGKSTTLNAIMGLIPSSAGKVFYNGEDITGKKTQDIVRCGIILVPEGRQLFPYLSVYKNLILGASRRTDKDGVKSDFEYVYRLFPKLRERRKQKAGTLSGGEQQMLAIARGIMGAPRLLCLDEPSLGLAPVIIEQLGESIREVNRERGTSILLVEQNVHLAFGLAGYCYTLAVGEVVTEGDIASIREADAVRQAYFGSD